MNDFKRLFLLEIKNQLDKMEVALEKPNSSEEKPDLPPLGYKLYMVTNNYYYFFFIILINYYYYY